MIAGILELVIRQVQDKSPYTIGIFGHGASGRTTFAKALAEKLGGRASQFACHRPVYYFWRKAK